MHKLLALYKTPEDSAAFLAHYAEVHAPLVAKLPGLLKTEFTRINQTFMGDKGNYLLAEMYFADEASFLTAMKSAENTAAGKDAANFGAGILTVMAGQTVEF